MSKIKSWKNKKNLISQVEYDRLDDKEGKYSSEKIESYFTLFESLSDLKSNPLLAVDELHFAMQGSMHMQRKLPKDADFLALRQKKEPSGTQFS